MREHCYCKKERVKFAVTLMGSQEVSDVSTPAVGTGCATLCRNRDCLKFEFNFRNLETMVKEPAPSLGYAHFHRAPNGANGPVVRTLDNEIYLDCDMKGGKACGVWSCCDSQSLTDELVEALLNNEIYINIHTAGNPGGEIRGQLIRMD